MSFDRQDLLGVVTHEGEPGFLRNLMTFVPHHRPIFGAHAINDMIQDPRICFGLELIKGPIHAFTKFFTEEEAKNPSVHKWIIASETAFPYVIKTKKEEDAEFISTTLRRFWQVGAIKALNSLEWGFSCNETIYKKSDTDGRSKKLYFDNLRDINPAFVKAVTVDGGLVGAEIKYHGKPEMYLGIPKVFWHTHQREKNRLYGQSRLFGAYPAWWEIWTEGGARDVRRMWWYRNSFGGGTMYYPDGYTKIPGGAVIHNRDLALDILSKIRSGGYLVFPNKTDTNGKQLWQYEPPTAAISPQGLDTYMGTLTNEELEGLGIPPEVIQGGGGGLGAATGRKIPMVAFYSTLQKTVDYLIGDVCAQIIDFLFLVNDRSIPDYEVVPLIPIKGYDDANQQDGGTPSEPKKPVSKIEKVDSGTPVKME